MAESKMPRQAALERLWKQMRWYLWVDGHDVHSADHIAPLIEYTLTFVESQPAWPERPSEVLDAPVVSNLTVRLLSIVDRSDGRAVVLVDEIVDAVSRALDDMATGRA
jgi:hypothetical protein